MTYETVIDGFKDILNVAFDYKVIKEQQVSYERVWVESGEGGSYKNVYTYSANKASQYITKIESDLDTLKTTIYKTLKCLFDDPEDTNGTEDLNHMMINGYGDSSKAYEYYNQTEDTFEEMPNYWFVRGHFTDLLVEANKGKTYLYDPCVQKVRNVVYTICIKYNNLYEKSNYTDLYVDIANGESSESTLVETAVQRFWEKNYEDFKTEVDNELKDLFNVTNNFSNLQTYILDFKGVFETYQDAINLGSEFVSALDKTSSNADTCLADAYASLDVEGLSKFSKKMGTGYAFFKEAKAIRDASKTYAPKDDSNYYLEKIMYSLILSKNWIYTDAHNNITWKYVKNAYGDYDRTMVETNYVTNYKDYSEKLLTLVKNYRKNVLKETLSS